MTDIVERAKFYANEQPWESVNWPDVITELADEIERLRAELNTVHAHLRHMRAETERLRDEIETDIVELRQIERLRAELKLERQRLKTSEELRTGLAAEIERLRNYKDEAETVIVAHMHEIERLKNLKTPASAKLLNVTKGALDNAEVEIERLRIALKIGVQLCESGGHGRGDSCPTCHFMRAAQSALKT